MKDTYSPSKSPQTVVSVILVAWYAILGLHKNLRLCALEQQALLHTTSIDLR